MATYSNIENVVTSTFITEEPREMHENAIARVDDTHVIVAATNYPNNKNGSLHLVYIEITETEENLLYELELSGVEKYDMVRGVSILMSDTTHGRISFYTLTKDANNDYQSWIVIVPFHISGNTLIQDGFVSPGIGNSLISYNDFDIHIDMCTIDSTHYAIIMNYTNSWDIGVQIRDLSDSVITNIVIDTLGNSENQSHSSIDKLKNGLLIINYGDKDNNTLIKILTYNTSTYAMSIYTMIRIGGSTGYNIVKRISDTLFSVMFTNRNTGDCVLKIYSIDANNVILQKTELTAPHTNIPLNVGDFCINNSDNLITVYPNNTGYFITLYNIQSDGTLIKKDTYSCSDQTMTAQYLSLSPITANGVVISSTWKPPNKNTFRAYIDRYKLLNPSSTTFENKIAINNTWKSINSRQISISGSWKSIKKIKIFAGGKWHLAYMNPMDTTPPSDVTNLTASNETGNSIDLAWNAATDNDVVSGYNIYMNGDYHSTVPSISSTINGLQAGTAYTFKIKAKDDCNNESTNYSNEITASTLANPAAIVFTQTFHSTDNWAEASLGSFSIPFSFIPTDAGNSTYNITLSKNNTVIDTKSDVTFTDGTKYQNSFVLSITPDYGDSYLIKI